METLAPKTQYKIPSLLGSPQRMGLFAAYDLSITMGPVQIEIGRFSHGAINRIRVYSAPAKATGEPLLTIGAFCDFGFESSIAIGGDHYNENMFNTTFGESGRYYKMFMSPDDLRLTSAKNASGVKIGDGVVLSTRATILDGSEIGEGCLIGANAILRGSTEPFGIYSGPPVRRVRDRISATHQQKMQTIDAANVAAHAIPHLASTSLAYQDGGISTEEMRKRLPLISARPRLHAIAETTDLAGIGRFEIKSFSIGGVPVTDASHNERLHRYFQQYNSSEDHIQWVPDVFLAMGLISTAPSDLSSNVGDVRSDRVVHG